MIRLEGVTRKFGEKTAVRDLSLEIPAGVLYAFLGPNGAGKTTTIKMMAGLLRPTEGRVIVGGFDLAKEPLKAKEILAYVPDQPYLYDKLSGREFLRFMADLYGMRGAGREAEMDRWIDTLGMGGWIDELSETYSHGMKQRVVMAATFLHRPKVVVVDEPMVGLDPPSIRRVKEIFRESVREGVTLFMSTHVISIAEETADRVGILFGGRLVAEGTVAGLREQSSTSGPLEDVFFRIAEAQGLDTWGRRASDAPKNAAGAPGGGPAPGAGGPP